MIRGGHYHFLLDTPGEQVPAVLQTATAAAPTPGALLLHGLSSSKERMADSIGRALLLRGISSLSIDLPLHGSREGNVRTLSPAQPFAIVSNWKLALSDARAAIDFLVSRPGVDASRIALVGYSLGAFLGVHVAADDSRVSQVVLAAGGDFPSDIPFAPLIRAIADPTRAVQRLTQPLLMVNGRFDRTVTPDQARRLYAAAKEPKELRWYDGGHWPPPRELESAADWIADRLQAANRRAV